MAESRAADYLERIGVALVRFVAVVAPAIALYATVVFATGRTLGDHLGIPRFSSVLGIALGFVFASGFVPTDWNGTYVVCVLTAVGGPLLYVATSSLVGDSLLLVVASFAVAGMVSLRGSRAVVD